MAGPDPNQEADDGIEIIDGVVDDEAEAQSTAPCRSNDRKSDVFSFVESEEMFDGQLNYVCLLCKDKGKVQRWKTRSTSNFRKHLNKAHSDQYSRDEKQSKLQRFGFQGGKRPRRNSSTALTMEELRCVDMKLVDWVVNHSQPLSVVDQSDFVEMMALASRQGYNVPSRNTLRSKVLKRWEEQKKKVRMALESDLRGRRCGLTTDMWTSAAKRGYMVVTMHYIDQQWTMRSVIIAFTRVLYPHSGERLATHLLAAVSDMSPQLLRSLWSITADNASSNPAMVEHINSSALQEAFESMTEATVSVANEEDVEADVDMEKPYPTVFLLRCFAHVIQLAVQEGLKCCSMIDAAIGRFRVLVKKINDSPKLQEALAKVCCDLKVTMKSLDLDVETRWNSTWQMVATVLVCRKALTELLRRIRQRHEGYTEFSITPSDPLAAEISEITWSVLADFKKFLTLSKTPQC